MALQRTNLPRRNDPCPCESGKKFKKCCGPHLAIERPVLQEVAPEYIDFGESAVRWVIVDGSGTKMFSDLDGHAIVFRNKDDAYAVAKLEDFADQEPGEINVAGVGETKWAALQNKIPFVEVLDAETATKLIRERIAGKRQELEAAEPVSEEPPAGE
jgi:hypothetical protein